MLEGLDKINWTNLNAPEIPLLLHKLTSEEAEVKVQAFCELTDKIAPPELFDEHGIYTDLLKLAETNLPSETTPFILELLEVSDNANKGDLLELLHDLACYVYLDKIYLSNIPYEEQIMYKHWSRRIYNAVYRGLPIYKKLLTNASSQIRQSAQDLLAILDQYRDTD